MGCSPLLNIGVSAFEQGCAETNVPLQTNFVSSTWGRKTARFIVLSATFIAGFDMPRTSLEQDHIQPCCNEVNGMVSLHIHNTS